MTWYFVAGLTGFAAISLLIKGFKLLVTTNPQVAILAIALCFFFPFFTPFPMAIVPKSQKILIGIAAFAVVLGVNFSHPKISPSLLLLGVLSGSTYLIIAPKPWIKSSLRRQRFLKKFSQYRDARSQFRELSKRVGIEQLPNCHCAKRGLAE